MKIFIYCDHPGHASDEVPVTNFVALPEGGWHEVPASRAGQRAGTGYHLRGDEPAGTGWALAAETAGGGGRDKFTLACRKCKGRPRGQRSEPVDLRRETLFKVLDGWRELGVLSVSLVAIAASVGRSKIRVDRAQNPEHRQG